MSLTYPLSLTTFVDKLKIDNIKALGASKDDAKAIAGAVASGLLDTKGNQQ